MAIIAYVRRQKLNDVFYSSVASRGYSYERFTIFKLWADDILLDFIVRKIDLVCLPIYSNK